MKSLHTLKPNLSYSEKSFLDGFKSAKAVRDEIKPINIAPPPQEPENNPVIEITPEPTSTPTPTPQPQPQPEVKKIIQPVILTNYGKSPKEESFEKPNQVSNTINRGAEGSETSNSKQ